MPVGQVNWLTEQLVRHLSPDNGQRRLSPEEEARYLDSLPFTDETGGG